MKSNTKNSPPLWLFAFIAVGAYLASGVYIGIMSVQGMNGIQLAQAIVFGLLGLLMSWMAYHKR